MDRKCKVPIISKLDAVYRSRGALSLKSEMPNLCPDLFPIKNYKGMQTTPKICMLRHAEIQADSFAAKRGARLPFPPRRLQSQYKLHT